MRHRQLSSTRKATVWLESRAGAGFVRLRTALT